MLKTWMIELWKGQYGLETGCEIGVYNRTIGSTSFVYRILDATVGQRPGDTNPSHNLFFDCASDSELLLMSSTLYRNGQKVFSRGPEKHWWLTGFKWELEAWINGIGSWLNELLDYSCVIEISNRGGPHELVRESYGIGHGNWVVEPPERISAGRAAGIPDAVVMALVGHESAAMSHRYTHVGKDTLAKAAKTLPEI
jgi:hypothetical protein